MTGDVPHGQLTSTTTRRRDVARRQRALTLRFEGKGWQEIAIALGIKHQSARSIGIDPEFQAELRAMQEESREAAKAVITRELVNAAETVVQLMRTGCSKQDEVRLDAAKDILDRGGLTSDSDTPQVNLNFDVDLTTVVAAERAYLAALGAQSADLGTPLRAGEPSGARHRSFRALSLPGEILDGPSAESDYLEIASGGHEPDGGA